MKMRKIVAILAAALMLFSMLPISAMAAEATATITFDNTSKRTEYSTSKQVWVENGITVTNNKSSSTSNVGNYSKPARFYASSNLIVECAAGNITQIVFDCNSGSYATALKNSIGTTATTSVNSDKVTATFSEPVESFTIAKLTAQVRMDGLTVTYTEGEVNTECDHDSLVCGDTCPECEEYVKEHVFANNCAATCSNCDEANPNYADHVYDGVYDAACNVCGETREVNFPEADSELTIPEANAIGLGMTHNTTTPGKYYVTGVVESIANTSYGNLYIQDEDGNKLYIYGTYSADGSTRFDAMAEQPAVGMTITVYGVIGNYSNAAQMKNGWITEMIGGCEHEYEFDCSTTCSLCDLELRPEAVCVNNNPACIDGLCIYCGGDVAGLGHAFDDQWDPDCNYGCGETREVEEKPELVEATVTFGADKAQRTEYTTSVQKWENDGLTVTNNKAKSTTNIGDYSNPGRFYKDSEIVISFPGMTSLVIDCSNTGDAKYSTPFGDMLTAAGLTYTVDSKVYTITFAEPTDSITLSCSAQVRANAITAVAAKQSDDGEEECAHQWNAATCTEPATCALCGAKDGAALGHNYVEDIIAATCTKTGTATYECSVCFDSYDETIPMKPHTYVDGLCSACGAELPLEATITFGEDKAQRTEFGTESQKWENNGLVLTNNKTADSNAIADYSNPIRMYKNSEIIISFPGMTSLVIDGPAAADYAWDATLTAAGLTYTAAEGVYTITFAEPTDSITLTAANQVRANKITATRVEEEHNHLYFVESSTAATCGTPGYTHYVCACGEEMIATVPATGEHTYFDDCSAVCEVCGYEREVSHNIVHVEAVAPTCAAMGNLEHWYCDVCGAAWLDAEYTQNTNLKAVKLPATGEHTYEPSSTQAPTCTVPGLTEYLCSVCGDSYRQVIDAEGHIYDDDYDADCNICGESREVPEKPPVEIIYGDANGDGDVTAMDVILLQQYTTGWDVELDEVSADANGDGDVTAMDVILLQQYTTGWDVTLGPADQDPADQEPPTMNDGEFGSW